MRAARLLFRALVGAPLTARPGQAGAMVGAIALGVAMISAIHWINSSALHSFEQGMNALSGRAEVAIVPTGSALNEDLLPRIRGFPEVAAAFPALHMELPTGPHETLPLLGVDLLGDAAVRGDYLPSLGNGGSGFTDLLRRGAVFLGRQAARSREKEPGDTLAVQVGAERVTLQVVGQLPAEAFWTDGAVMDLATAQWTFDRLGELDRIDVILKEGAQRQDLARRLEAVAGARARLQSPRLQAERLEAMTQAYRINLEALALVGLVTAAFLVYSLLTLSMRRRRRQFALMRVLGLERQRLAVWLLGEGALLGLVGSGVGLVLGLGLAWLGVTVLGGDLGAGYFEGIQARLNAQTGDMLALGGLGILVALVGTLVPVRDNIRASGEAAMRRGAAETGRRLGTGWRLGLAGVALGGAGGLAQLPAWQGIPLAGYGAMALVLSAGLLLAPLALRGLVWVLPSRRTRASARVARAQLQGAPRRAAMAVSAALVSFSLLVATATLVHSFRDSVIGWLDQILVADLYVSGGPAGQTAFIPEQEWRTVAGWRGVRRLDLFRHLALHQSPASQPLGPSAAPVRLTARQLDFPETRSALELLRGRWPKREEERAVLVSEVFARAFEVAPGDSVRLPVGGVHRSLRVVGVWQDFSYRGGHVLLDWEAFVRFTGDRRADEFALYLEPGADRSAIRQRLERFFQEALSLEVTNTREIRRRSMTVFDQTFAVTYVLVVLAVAVGLLGTLLSLAVQGLERRGEMAMLRYLGFRVRDVARSQAEEAVLIAGLGGMLGLAVGAALAVILVKVVNEQSFLWSLPVAFPWGTLALAWLALVVATTASGWFLGQVQGRRDPTQAVGEE